MNLTLLDSMSTEALNAIQDKVKGILQARLRSNLHLGSRASFLDANGHRRCIMITRINDKTVSGVEVEPRSGGKWRVSKMLLQMEASAAPAVPTVPAVKHVPSTAPNATGW